MVLIMSPFQVCLSILNTWHGRPEEKWNPQTSSFLQVSYFFFPFKCHLGVVSYLLVLRIPFLEHLNQNNLLQISINKTKVQKTSWNSRKGTLLKRQVLQNALSNELFCWSGLEEQLLMCAAYSCTSFAQMLSNSLFY